MYQGQAALDFVDVDLDRDLPFYVDPTVLRVTDNEFTTQCCALIQDYFQTVLDAIRTKNDALALRILSELGEPNEVYLGLSAGTPRGRGIGSDYAESIWTALKNSAAVATGLIQDVEDSLLFIEGIGPDRISDLVVNVIRAELVQYTHECCDLYGIKAAGTFTAACWNPHLHEWESRAEALPMPKGKPLLLVPRFIVRRHMNYAADRYYTQAIIPYLRSQELEQNGELVRIIKTPLKARRQKAAPPRKVVYSDDIRGKYGDDKAAILKITEQHPEVLERYREQKRVSLSPPPTLDELGSGADLGVLYQKVKAVKVGSDAKSFEDGIRDLIAAIFSQDLSIPKREVKMHGSRKRVDLTFSNTATGGFFEFAAKHYPAANILFECKNYSTDPENPEIDQLLGRFSPSRGKLGFLVCREIKDRRAFVERCIGAAADDQGWVIGLDDRDLLRLSEIAFDQGTVLKFLKDRLDELVNRQFTASLYERVSGKGAK